MMAQEVKTIGRNGIRFLKSDYFEDTLYGMREKVIIKYSLFDLNYIKVYSIKGGYLCTANRVMSTYQLAHYLGDINDIEDYKQKITKQKNLRNKTLKAVREHFSVDDLDLIGNRLAMKDAQEITGEVLVQDPPQKPKFIISERVKSQACLSFSKRAHNKGVAFIAKIKPSMVARPIFKNNFERYEWHLKQGCICQKDRKWFESYIKSDEFKEIYEWKRPLFSLFVN